MTRDLFDAAAQKLASQSAPLADRMRPDSFSRFLGQDELTGAASPLRRAIEEDAVTSMILWGPPGSGKTTLAHLIAKKTDAYFVSFSAVVSGVKDARAVIAAAEERLAFEKRRTILFVDEIHRFNKAQQDAFLPYVEKGVIILIGATTENPSFEINAALLSRCRVFVLKQLDDDALVGIIKNALDDESRGLGKDGILADDAALQLLAQSAGGDARAALSNLEWVAACLPGDAEPKRLTADHVQRALPKKTLLYDKTGEEHYNLISALHKSIRGSDPQGALYWLARMLASGEDPMFLARRLVRIAMEDVGLADPQALVLAVAARDAYHFLGTPEGELGLAQIAVYLATAPKSNSVYVAMKAATSAAEFNGSLPVPLHIRNAPTKLMKNLDYGKGYQYAFDFDNAYAPQTYLPEKIRDETFYQPGRFGFEKEIKKRLDWWKKMREAAGGDADADHENDEKR